MYTPNQRGRTRETSGDGRGPCLFSGTAKARAPWASPRSGGRDQPVRGASFPLGRPGPRGRRYEAGAGFPQKWPLPHLPCPPPGPSQARPEPRHPSTPPGLRGRLSSRPEPPGRSLRRSTPAESQASATAAAILTILSLGSAQSPQPPPPSSSDASEARPLLSQPMRKGDRGRPLYDDPPTSFTANEKRRPREAAVRWPA